MDQGTDRARRTPKRRHGPNRSRAGAHCAHDELAQIAGRAVRLFGSGDRAAVWVASRQHRVLEREQARLCGLGRKAIERRVRTGLWRAERPRVLVVGPDAVGEVARVLAAVLSCGRGAVGSHRTAAYVHGFTPNPPRLIDVTVPRGRHPRARGEVRLHRPKRSPGVHWKRGVPVSSPAMTLIACAGSVSVGELEAMVGLAARAGAVTVGSLAEQASASAGVPGAAVLRRLLDAGAPALTRSRLERRMRELLVGAGLGPITFNADVHGHEADIFFPAQRLVVEVDTFATHGEQRSFESDRRRDSEYAAAGIATLRFTDRRITREPYAVVAELAAALALRDPRR